MRVSSLGLVASVALALAGCKDTKAEASRRSEAQMAGHIRDARAGVDQLTRTFVPVLEGLAPSLTRPITTHDNPGVRFALIGMSTQHTPAGSLSFFPTGFITAVGPDGVSMARNTDETSDLMRGMQLATLFPSIRGALAGTSGLSVGELPATQGTPSRVFLVASVPVRDAQNAVIGALAAGISYGQIARSIDTAVRVHSGQQPVIWVGLVRDGRVLPSGHDRDVAERWLIPAPLIAQIPSNAATRLQGPNAQFTWTFIEGGARGWGAAMAVLPQLEGTNLVMYRSEAQQN